MIPFKRTFKLDAPSSKNFSFQTNLHFIRGWFLDKNCKSAGSIRIRLGNRIISCKKINRVDVRECFSDKHEVDLDCGFEATFKTGLGFKQLRFEVLNSQNEWQLEKRIFLLTREQKAQAKSQMTSQYQSALDTLWQSCKHTKLKYGNDHCPITWVIPDFNSGGGGHLNIFRMIKNIESIGGPKQQIIIVGHHSKKDRFEARESARDVFFKTEAKIYLHTDIIPTSDCFIATGWQTAYFVRQIDAYVKKFYFVQDFEPSFYASGSNSALAENTYRFGFKTITAGKWLSDILQRDYNLKTVFYGFSYDKELYSPPTKPVNDFDYDIFFYARPHTERRMYDLGVDAINEAVKLSNRKLKIAFAGSSIPTSSTPFEFRNLGVLSLDQLADHYRRTRCGFVLSATNASLLPYELMACGCPIVTNKGANNEWLFPQGYGGLAETTPESLGKALNGIIHDQKYRDTLSKEGLEITSKTDWLEGSRSVLRFITSQLDS